jgi:hypothetical protein
MLIAVYVRHSEYHLATGYWVGVVVMSATPLTFTFCTVYAYQFTDQLPLWVILFVVYGHGVGAGFIIILISHM